MIPGQRLKIAKWIHSDLCAIRMQVEAIIPDADPSEPCFEPPAIKWMDKLQRLANENKIDELAKIDEVYVRRSA